MKHFLVKPYNRDEVEIALKQMPPSKAPRIDGMPAVFFQKYWHILGDEVTVRILSFSISYFGYFGSKEEIKERLRERCSGE
ncbi:unnamed protein product [Prunus armeniaca]